LAGQVVVGAADASVGEAMQRDVLAAPNALDDGWVIDDPLIFGNPLIYHSAIGNPIATHLEVVSLLLSQGEDVAPRIAFEAEAGAAIIGPSKRVSILNVLSATFLANELCHINRTPDAEWFDAPRNP
jgi:hypothetical protein